MTASLIWMLTPVAAADRGFFLAQFGRQVAQAPDPSRLRCIAVLQSPDAAAAETFAYDARAIHPGTSVLHMPLHGVSQARNLALTKCLEDAGAKDHILFRDCRSILDGQFLEALLARAKQAGIARTARMIWSDAIPAPFEGQPGPRRHVDLIGRPTVGQFAFRPRHLERVRFREMLGPGDETVVKSGEDVLFLADVFMASGSWEVADVPGTLILAPRTDLDAKRAAYATGQVYVARVLIGNRRLPGAVRGYAVLRLLLFTIGTLRFLRPGTWGLFRRRIMALLDGPKIGVRGHEPGCDQSGRRMEGWDPDPTK